MLFRPIAGTSVFLIGMLLPLAGHAAWQAHEVRLLNGEAGSIGLAARFQIVTETWNRVVDRGARRGIFDTARLKGVLPHRSKSRLVTGKVRMGRGQAAKPPPRYCCRMVLC